MNETLRQMERVKQFRETRERMSEAALAVATGKLREAETRLESLRRAEADAAERCGQFDGGTSSRVMSLALMQAFGMDTQRQQGTCEKRVATVTEMQSELRSRRIESEQAVALCRKQHEAALIEMEKQEQTETVDRFLARSRWSSAKIRVRNLSEAA